ncbi:MAG: dihydrofolate reductase [Saccharofermentans sp.]|nr:dihydrofolate reductase [Saccharofermentans sp.]
MIAIAAVDMNWGIGYAGELLVSLPEDQKGVFRKYTSGHTVVYGRKTLKTYKDERLLPNRINVILTHDETFEKEGAVICHSVEELNQYLATVNDEVYLIGGETTYKLLLDRCDKAIITYIQYEFMADAFFPNLDEKLDWELVSEEPAIESAAGVTFCVRHYERIKEA